jgi:hypothetical protein
MIEVCSIIDHHKCIIEHLFIIIILFEQMVKEDMSEL